MGRYSEHLDCNLGETVGERICSLVTQEADSVSHCLARGRG